MTREMTERNNLISELNSKVKDLTREDEKRESELEGRRRQVELLEKYKDELEQELDEKVNSYDKENGDINNKLYEKSEEVKSYKNDVERLKDCVMKYEVEYEQIKKDNRILEMEIKDCRKSLVDRDKEKDKWMQERFTIKEAQSKNEGDKDVIIMDLQAEIASFNKQKKEMQDEFAREVERMIGFHKQALELLKDENRVLDDRFKKEIEERRDEVQKYKEKERG